MRRDPSDDSSHPHAGDASEAAEIDTERNPWRTLSQRVVYDNPWIRVEEHDVINPAGNPGIYGKVCFKNRAVAVIALDDAQRVFLVGQYRYTLDAYSWELPMGGAGPGEEPLEAARRELLEETGLVAERWAPLMQLHTTNSVTDEVAYVFVAHGLVQGAAAPEETEDLRIRLLPLAEAVTWVCDGRITDAVSAAGLLRFVHDYGGGTP